MTSSRTSLRILVADDHNIMRRGLQAVIEQQTGWEVCGVASTGREAVAQATKLTPDIVVMDMTMPELNGLDAAIQIKRRLPNTEIVMLTAHQDDDLIRAAFEAGIKSFIFKSEAQDVLLLALEALARHKPFFTPKVSEVLFSSMVNRAGNERTPSKPGQRLSVRERELVQLLADGKSNKEIADALGISVRTAETHRASVMRKLRVNSVAGIVRYAIRNKLIEP
jgi:DNA-binding NarL/FixJ family response regulator